MIPEKTPSLEDFDFIQVHSLAHKFSHPYTPEHDKRRLAENALRLMDKYQALHPAHQQMCNFLSLIEDGNHGRFDDAWILAIKDSTTTSMLCDEDSVLGDNKADILHNVMPLIKSSFVRADFQMLEYYLNKLHLSTQFSKNVHDEASFTANRFFEFLLHQMLCVLYGQFWFRELNVTENDNFNSAKPGGDTLNWAVIEKRADSYYGCCTAILDTSDVARSELDFYWAIKWCCAFIKFKESRFEEFVDSFESIRQNFAVTERLALHSKTLVLYTIACIATRPFKELVPSVEDETLDLGPKSISASIHQLLDQLSAGNFVEAKELFHYEGYIQGIESELAYALPSKSVGTFWDAFEVIIDSKVFLLIMSMTKQIQRDKMLEKMGYADAEPAAKNAVSNNMLLLLSVLGLGEAGVHYNQESDRFCNFPTDKKTKELQLQQRLATVNHTIRAKAAATQMQSLLVSRFFQELEKSQEDEAV